MDSIHFYQPPGASLCGNGRPTASNLRVPKASGDCNNYGLIDILNITGLPPKESHDSIRAPALDLCTEADASDTSNGLNTTYGYGRSGGEEDDDFLPVKELLFNIGEAPEWQWTGSSDEHVTRGSECNSGYTAEGDYNNAQLEAGGGD